MTAFNNFLYSSSHMCKREMKAWFITYSSTNAMENLTRVFTVLVLIATTRPTCLWHSVIIPVLWLRGQLAVRYAPLGWHWKLLWIKWRTFCFLFLSFRFFVLFSSQLRFFLFSLFCSFCFICYCVTIQAFYYPPKAGYPIGTADSPSSYMLELHYDNPDGVEGQNCCT